jgi:hypothetical protein
MVIPNLCMVETFVFSQAPILTKSKQIVMQPVFSTTVLMDMIKPDGSCAIPVLSGEPLSAELAHELMGIQVIFF